MKSKILIVTTAAAMAAGTYYAVAQTAEKGDKAQAPAASSSQSAPSSAGQAVPSKSGQMTPSDARDKAAQITGSTPMKAQESKSENGAKPATSGQAPSSAQSQSTQSQKASPSTSGQSPSSTQSQSGSSSMSKDASPSSKSSTQSSPNGSATKASPGTAQTAPAGLSSSSAQTSGAQGSASASLSTEQRTQIRTTVLAERNAPRVSSVNFSLNVGTVVPRTVHVVALPSRVVTIYPAWRGFMYFVVGDQIVIVEPGSLRIVAVIAA